MSHFTQLDIKNIFGEQNMIRLSENKKSQLDISPDVKQFLSDIGLPHQQEELSLIFSLDFGVIPESSNDLAKFLIIGMLYDISTEKFYEELNQLYSSTIVNDDLLYICLNKENDSIYSVSADPLHQISFINTNIACLGEALAAYRESQNKVDANLDDDEFIYDEIEKLKERLIEIDPVIFDSEENWWTSIFSRIYG